MGAFTERERLDWLRLFRSETIGPITFRELIRLFGSATSAIDGLPALAKRAGRRVKVVPLAEAEAESEALAAIGGRFVAAVEPDYPALLRHVDDAPPILALRGEAAVFKRPAVAVVGARNASAAGASMAKRIARGLGALGYVVVSGLARGIDAAAHEAALATGTVGVSAAGLDKTYPPENIPLAERIVASGGCHVSEMPLGSEARAKDFPRRNRIVSGMALGVVVIEAAERSGSLITARLAAKQGRLVFAVPGSPLDPRAAGTNRLIREGVELVTGPEDVAATLEPMLGRDYHPPVPVFEAAPSPTAPLDADEADRARLIEALGPSPVDIDELIRFTGLKAAMVHLVLLELDLAGRLDRHPGQRVSLR
ncbi:MAG: DNA-protecting protein DprA [Bauldia sp.]|nr:DNA-protecting protein DprA [Bauldia sp.]